MEGANNPSGNPFNATQFNLEIAGYLRTEDIIYLNCESKDEQYVISSDGFGSSEIFLGAYQDKFTLWKSAFIIEQATSVHMLNTQLHHDGSSKKSKSAQSGNTKIHKTLTYGNAIILRHVTSKKYLTCQPRLGNQSDYKLRFVRTISDGCWFIVHPGNTAYCIGDKVKSGDGVLLKNHLTERYIYNNKTEIKKPSEHRTESIPRNVDRSKSSPSSQKGPMKHKLSKSFTISEQFEDTEYIGSKELKKIELKIDFKKTIWRIMVLASSDARDLYQDYLSGEDYIQIYSPMKGYLGPEVTGDVQTDKITHNPPIQRKSLSCLDEFLSKESRKEDQSKLIYKQDTSGVGNVWRVETIKSVGGKWGASFVRWQQAFNLVNVVTGTYLAYSKVRRELCLAKLDEIVDTYETIDFKCMSSECKEKIEKGGAKATTNVDNAVTLHRSKEGLFFDEEEFPPPQIKFAESSILLLADTEQMPCIAFDTFVTDHKESNVATTSQDHKCIFSLNFSLVPSEKAYAANLICVTEAIVDAFKSLRSETLKNEFKNFYPVRKNLRNMLSDLKSYLEPQGDNTWDEVDSRDPTMKKLSLRAKQTLFSSEGILFEFPAILAYLQELRCQIRTDVKRDHLRMINELTRDILEVIALMIDGNPENCQKLVRKDWLDIFFDLLDIQAFFEGVLKVLHLAVKGSPAVLTLFSENTEYFDRIFNLLKKFGRNEKVLDLLSALCVHEGVAIRRNQDNITKLLLCSDIRNSLFLKTYSVGIVDFFRPNIFLHYVPGSATYAEWFFEVEFKSISDNNDDNLHTRVGWAYAEYFKTEPTVIGYESQTQFDAEPVNMGVGSDLTSIGFDGQFLWIGGNKYPVEGSMDDRIQIVYEPITIGCYLDMQKGRAWFFLNGKQVNISITGIAPEEFMTPVVSLRGQVEAVVRFGKEFGKFKYPPPQHLFKPAPLCDARLSIHDSLKMEKWVCPDQMDSRLDIATPEDPLPQGVVTLSSPISLEKFYAFIPIQAQDLEPMTPSTSMADRRKSVPDFALAFQLGSKKQDLAEFLHDAWSEKCISLDYKWGEVTDPLKKTMRELDHFDKLDQHDQEDYISLAEVLIDGLNKYECNFDLLNWKYDRPRRRSEVYQPLQYNLVKSHWNRYHDAISRQLAEYVHNQICMKRIQRGWRYGYEMDEKLKLHPSLRPLDSFEQTTLTYLRLRHLINSTIMLVLASSGGNLELKQEEETKMGLSEELKSETRFTTFKVSNQFAVSYNENGNNRWYFEAIIKSEGQIRVGWATTDTTPGIPLGDDKHSYAFSGYLVACKCHNNTESFGKTWKKDSILGCFLDLNDGTIIFSLDGLFLRSSNNVKYAFNNIPGGKHYLPAVSLGPEQKVILNFGQKQDSLQMLQKTFEQSEVFKPFGEGIISNIPIYISLKANDSVKIEKSGTQPVRILNPPKQWKTPPPIKIQLTKKTRMLYISLNMGICPIKAKEERFSFSVSIPNLDKRQTYERGFIGFTTSHFTQMTSQYQLQSIGESQLEKASPGPVYSLDKECLGAGIVGEENTPGELISFYLIPLTTFIDQFTNEKPQAVNTNFLRVTCVMDLTTSMIQFYLDEDFISEIPLLNLHFYLYPTLLYAGNLGEIIEFDFNKFKDCSPFIHGLLDPAICGDNVFTERMHLRISTPHKWSNLELNSNRYSIHLKRDEGISINSKLLPSQTSLLDTDTCEDNAFANAGEDLPRRFSRVYSIEAEVTHLEEDAFEFFPYQIPKFEKYFYHVNKNMYLLVPEESSLISLMDAVEDNQLIEFYTKTILLLISVCDKDFIKAKEMVLDYVGFQHLLSSLELGIQQLIPVQLSLAIYKLCIALFLEAEFNLKAMTRKESLIEMMTGPSQIITVLPRDPTINDVSEEDGSTSSVSRWHFYYGSQLLSHLKGMVFAKLWEIMSQKIYTCTFLKGKNMREGVLMPLLNVIKHLVLTEKLDPIEYTWLMLIIEPKYKGFINDETRYNEIPFEEGLLSILDLEDSIKYEICSILDFLYDLHIRRQVYKTVHFMMNISNELKQKQEEKMEYFKNQPHHPSGRELRQPPSQQIEYFLEQVTLCVADKFYESPIDKLKNYYFYFKSTFECISKVSEDAEIKPTQKGRQDQNWGSDDAINAVEVRTVKLRDGIIEGLLKWAKQIADNHPLREIIFSLVRRYMSRVEEFRDVLARTYVLPKGSQRSETSEASRAAEILGALGYLRSVLNIKLNQEDETRLTLAISTLTNANVLFQYPDSLFILGVYEAVLNVMEHILRECLPKQVQSKLKKRISAKFGTLRKMHSFGITQNTFACCIHFLCSLIRYFPLFSIHSSNSIDVFFSQIDKLIELSFIYVHSTKKYALSSPLEVVNSLIKQNEKLTLSLKENQITQILEFLTNTLFKVPENKWRKFEVEYEYRHGLCYLDFLKYAVSSQEKYIETNAKIVVMYFINHKETIDLALLNFFSKQTITSEPELLFYTNFLDLLGKCAPPRKYPCDEGSEDSTESQNENLQFQKKTCLLLQNFISKKQILDFLSLKGHQSEEKWMLYKSALIVILDRIHGITDPPSASESKTDTEVQKEYENSESGAKQEINFLTLVDGPFLCDLSRALLKHQIQVSDSLRGQKDVVSFKEDLISPMQDLNYIMNAVLPVMTKGFHNMQRLLLTETDTHILNSTLYATYWVSFLIPDKLPGRYKKPLVEFFSEFAIVVPPSIMCNFFRCISRDISHMRMGTSQVVFKFFQLHLEHYESYYNQTNSELQGRAKSTEQEDLVTLFFQLLYYLLKINGQVTSKDQTDDHPIIPALVVLSGCISPMTLTKTQIDDLLSDMNNVETAATSSLDLYVPFVAPEDSFFPYSYYNRNQKRSQERRRSFSMRRGAIGYNQLDEKLQSYAEKFWGQIKDEIILLNENLEQLEDPNKASKLMSELVDCLDQENLTVSTLKPRDRDSSASILSLQSSDGESSLPPARSDIVRRDPGLQRMVSQTGSFQNQFKDEFTERLSRHLYFWVCGPHSVLASPVTSSLPMSSHDAEHMPFELLISKKRRALKDIINYFFQLLDYMGLRVRRGPSQEREGSNFLFGTEDAGQSPHLQRFCLRLLRGTKLFLERTTGDDPAYRVPTSLQDIDEAGSPFVAQKKPKATYSTINLKFFLRVLVPVLNRHFYLHNVYYLKSGRVFYQVTATAQESDELSNLFAEFVTHLPKIHFILEASNRSIITLKLKVFLKSISDAIEVTPKMAEEMGGDGTYNLSLYMRSGSHILELVSKRTGEYSSWSNISCTLTIMLPFFINLFRKIVSSLEEDVVEYFDNLEDSIREKIKPYLKILFNSLMKIGIQPEIQDKLVMKEQVGTCIGLLTQVAPLAIFKEKMESYGVNPNNWQDMMSRSELIGENIFHSYINLPILTYTLAKSGRDPEVDPIKFHKWVDQFVEEAFNYLTEMVRINQDFVLLWTESHMEKIISWCSPDVFWRKFLEVITEVRIHLLYVYNADKAEQYKIQTQSQNKMGYTNIDNKYFQTMYKMVAQQYIATISLLWRYLNKDNIREEVERENVNDKFVSLLIILMEIFDIWCESQSFKKECLSLVKCIKELIVFSDSMLLGVIFTDMEVNTNYPLERRSAIVLILRRILHFGKAIPFIENNERLINEGVKLLQEGKSQHGVSDLITENFSSYETPNPKQGPIKKLTSIANRVLSRNDGDHIQLFIKEFILMKHRLTVMANRTSPGGSKWKWLRHKQIIRNMIKFLASKQLCKMANFRVTNYLIQGYRIRVLSALESEQNLIRNLVQSNVSKGSNASGASLERVDFQPIAPLVSLLEVPAKTAHDEQLYLEYTRYLFQACDSLWNELDENDDTMDDERDTTEVENRKYRRIALEKLQEKLNDLDVPQMVVKVLIYCGGTWSASVYHCLQLGIAILRGGNEAVQESMLTFITKTCPKETPLFRNISKLITTSPVLDLELFNRGKAIMTQGHTTSKVNALGHYKYTIALFRFLQLLCEGHNASFQEYLHTQAGKSTTVNLVQITVDYLLLLQESISSFCWHYNNMDHIEIMGQDNISCAFSVIKQVLITLTEYIQGPCKLNQTALSRSRLWDAIQGLLRLFAYLQEQLSNTNSIELLREVLKVLSDMIILLLSMLEGNQMSSEIGVAMKHTLVDCRNELQDITKFCFMFIKLNDTLTSKAFAQYDTNKDGRISRLEFERSLQTQKQYSQDEVDYLMRCGDTNRDGYIDYAEFLDRFLLRAEEIGFNLVVLLQNLFEHLPKTNSDFELNDLRNRGKELMEFFNNHLGSIEIIGKSRTVEKVYFQIPKSCRDQWARSQIQESKREFINTCDHENVNSKLDKFIDFSENTIFEMRHFGKLCQVEEWERESRAKSHRDQNRDKFRDIQPGPQSQEYTTQDTARGSTFSATFKAKCFGIFLLVVHILAWCGRKIKPFIPKRFRRKKHPEPSASSCWLTEDTKCRLPGEAVLEIGECVELEPSHLMKEAKQYYEKSKIIPTGFSAEYMDLKNKKHSRWRKAKQYIRELTQLTHYWPLIIQSNFRFSSFLVENEQMLKSLRFFSVIFMNFLLLFFYQSDQDMFAYDYKLTLMTTASLHITLSLLLLYTYIMWKVPLECFKREKKICIEVLQNSDTLKSFLDSKSKPFLSQHWWDAWALKSDKFPRMYWDKYFKHKVRENYAEMDRDAEIVELLGEDVDPDRDEDEEVGEYNYKSLNEYTHGKFGVDYNYAVWMLFRVYLSDRNLLFSLMYICFTCIGLLFDNFFFAFHLIPEMMAYFSTLRTVVVSVTIHGKRLVYTTLLMSAVIFIYTVFAFRFFTTYYNNNCTNMVTCLQFHLSAALRSGGGVSDVIETPDKTDPLLLPRFLFDMSFFFIVIVFLLAIIQGLIIDAFGELRDREEGVRASMQNKCFICGINKDKFNQVPRGYEKHTNKEHYYPNYLFFLMYLINKHDTLYTGQESYVWDLYLQRKWDFFPIGCYFEQNNDLPGAENNP